jgi:RNA polymerase sigma-70 factor, ECF subfamily
MQAPLPVTVGSGLTPGRVRSLGADNFVTDDTTLRTVIASAAGGDVTAFARIVETYNDDMVRVAFVVTNDAELARSAVEAAWPKAWRDLASKPTPELLWPWLLALAAREAREQQQVGKRGEQEAEGGVAGVAATRASAAPAYRSDQREVANALAPLDAHDRMIVGLRYVAGLGMDEIGRELGMPVGSVQARVARILSGLLKDLQGEPTETIEHYERGLTQLVRSYGDLAVVPIDTAEVAKAAAEAGAVPEPGLAEQVTSAGAIVWEQLAPVRARLRRLNPLDWLLVAGVLVIVVAVVFAGGGSGLGGPGTGSSSDASRACRPDELDAGVTAWEVAGAYRNATVEMRNTSSGACLVNSMAEPWLTAWPRDAIMIGHDFQGSQMKIGAGQVLKTIVSVRNYCGPAPRPPVSLAFRNGSNVIAARPLSSDDVSGLPPCGGYPGTKDDVQMQAWAPAP